LNLRKNVLCSLILISLVFSILGLENGNGETNQLINGKFSTLGTDSYTETFLTTTYADPSTTAWGWGIGALSIQRDYTLDILDVYPTNYPVKDIVVQGRKAYLACHNPSSSTETLQIVNLTNLYNMKLIGMRDSSAGMLSIDINGDTLIIGISYTNDRINSYNVTFPSDIAVSGNYLSSETYDGDVTDVDIEGHLAFTTANGSISSRSLRVTDISDPRNMFEISNNWDSRKTYALDIHGGLGYLAEGSDGFKLVNLTNRVNIGLVGQLDTAGCAVDIIADGDLVYIADYENGVVIIDTSNPTSPVIVGHYDFFLPIHKLAKIGTTLFAAHDWGVLVLDVANPMHPIQVTAISAADIVNDIELYGGDLLIGTDDGLYAYRIGGGIGDFSTDLYYDNFNDYEVWDVRVWGTTAFIAGGPDGFYTVDVSDPLNPVLLDIYPVASAFFKKLDIDGTMAYLVDDEGIYIFDIANPANIRFVTGIGGSGLTDIYAEGGLFYCTTNVGFAIVNMTNPYSYDVILDYNMGGVTNLTAIWVQGPHVHLVEDIGVSGVSMYIYNIVDMTNPILCDTVYQPGYFWDVFVDGDMAYYGCTSSMYVYNVSNPTGMSQWGYTTRNSLGVWGFGPYIISADSNEGVSLVNNTDPGEQVIESIYSGISNALQVSTYGDLSFVANRYSLCILRHFRPAASSFASDMSHAWSLEVDSVDYPILDATLTAIENTDTGSINYRMSADGGAHWETVTPGVKHYFTNVGNDLRWEATLIGSLHRSSYLYQVDIDYTYNDTAPITSPTPTITPTNTSTATSSLIGGFLGVSLTMSASFLIIAIIRRRKKA